jgi:hypothetical protein
MTKGKSAPEKVLAKKLFYLLKSLKKIVFWAKLFLGALFTKVIFTFLKSVRKDGFFDAPFDLSDSYPAFFLPIATTSKQKFLKVQKL